mgnify:CR=1 FL=1
MKIETRTKTQEYKVYIASDKVEFTSHKDCEDHEHLIANHTKVWVITDSGYRKGNIFVTIFSTKEKADRWVDDSPDPRRFRVVEHFIDKYDTI